MERKKGKEKQAKEKKKKAGKARQRKEKKLKKSNPKKERTVFQPLSTLAQYSCDGVPRAPAILLTDGRKDGRVKIETIKSGFFEISRKILDVFS